MFQHKLRSCGFADLPSVEHVRANQDKVGLDNRGQSKNLDSHDREAEFPLGHFDVSECKLLSCQDLLTDPYSPIHGAELIRAGLAINPLGTRRS